MYELEDPRLVKKEGIPETLSYLFFSRPAVLNHILQYYCTVITSFPEYESLRIARVYYCQVSARINRIVTDSDVVDIHLARYNLVYSDPLTVCDS